MFELNGTYVIFIVSFLSFMWLLNEIVLKPVGKTLEERSKLIQQDIEAGKAARVEAGNLQTSYEQDLKRIRGQAQGEINKALEEAAKQRTNVLDAVAKEGKASVEKARAALAQERGGLIDALVAQEQELVETITKKVLGDDSVNVNVDASQVRRELEEAR